MAKRSFKRKSRRTFKPKAKVSAARVRRIVYNMAEKKYFNQSVGTPGVPHTMAATWTFFSALTSNLTSGSVAGLVPGTGAFNRLGNKILLKSITYTIFITPTATAGMADGCTCRVVLYHNTEASGTAPTGLTMFTTDTVYANRNVDYLSKMSLQRDMVHSMVALSNNAGTVNTVGPGKLFKVTVYPNKVIDFTNTTGSISDLLKHDYGIGFCATESTGCNMICNMQTIFTDL